MLSPRGAERYAESFDPNSSWGDSSWGGYDGYDPTDPMSVGGADHTFETAGDVSR